MRAGIRIKFVVVSLIAGTIGAGTIGASTWTAGATATGAPASRLSAAYPAPEGVTTRPSTRSQLVADPGAYAGAKREAATFAARAASRAPQSGLAPTATRNWAGVNDTTHAPSDSTGAVGPNRYIELVNEKYAIYSKVSNTPIATGPLPNLTGCAAAGCPDSIFDPQIIWDPTTNRFYYAADDVVSASSNFLSFGFSKTASPSSSADWCRYNVGFGSLFPDYPKLGDTTNFALIGVNMFNSSSNFVGSDVQWISKPPAGPTCPSAATFKNGLVTNLKNANGTVAFTPVPGNQIDSSPTGWIVARPGAIPTTGATNLTLFKVTNVGGNAVIPATGTSVAVPAYKIPPNAPQKGTAFKIDTSDTRNTQAVLATDPTRGAVALWTQHTVLGGAGAEVRWYEINPATHSLFQSGKLTSATLFEFNGAISSDRAVNGATSKFGGNMVLNANTSSSSTASNVVAVSKRGAAAQSGPIVVATSTGPDHGFDCVQLGFCRWGDYAAATPDPTPTGATLGTVWGSSMLSFLTANSSIGNWTTRNFAITP